MEKNSTQKPLSKEEILAKFANTGFDARFADFFYERYLDEFEVWEDYDNPNEWALKCVEHGLTWYSLYHQIGHHEQWCKAAYGFGCEGVQIDVSLESEIECMAEVTARVKSHSKELFISTKDSEFAKHFDHIKKQYKMDGIFILFYSEYAKEFGLDRDICDIVYMLDIVSRKTRAYTDAIERMKSEDFASYYATLIDINSEQAWKVAELRESLQKEGWDEDYIQTYLYQYTNALEEDGEEREHPDIPAYWEDKVYAFMKGWDYARKHNLDIRFAESFRDIYLNLAHPDDIPDYPFSETENKAIEETLKLYGKSI